MAKVIRETWTYQPTHNRFYIFCPGCYEESKRDNPDKPNWWVSASVHCFNTEVHQFNGDMDRPTLSPSLAPPKDSGPKRCHSYVKDGKIQFLGDCTHPLVGQTVDLMDVPQEYIARNPIIDE